MRRTGLPFKLLVLCWFAGLIASRAEAEEPTIRFKSEANRVQLIVGEQAVADYVFRDEAVSRPYFAHIKTISGQQVSRNFPPQDGVDKTDHANMHPGIWLSFGDLNGHDYWRLKAKTEHVRFLAEPHVEKGTGNFKVLNRYLATDSSEVVCEEECEVGIQLVDESCYLLTLVSDFKATSGELRFGDQEEMGLGIRVASPLAVDRNLGGRILDSERRVNGNEIWGKVARWCDYSGPMAGKWCGMTVFTSPQNFRGSWAHARDYGFVAMNPFGINAFTKADKQDITIKKGESLRLGYAVAIHESASESAYDPEKVYQQFVLAETSARSGIPAK